MSYKAKAVPLHAMKALRERGSIALTHSAIDGSKWSASRPSRALAPGKETSGTHCTGRWVGPRAGLDTEAKGKNPFASARDQISIAWSSSP
jgi:hypothetical protein